MKSIPHIARADVWYAAIAYPLDAPKEKVNPLQLPYLEGTVGGVFKFRWEGLDMVIAQTLEDFGALWGDKFIEQAMEERDDAWWTGEILCTREWLRREFPRPAEPDLMNGSPRRV